MIYFTSDTHFGHANVIKYCSRPFNNTAHMEDELIARWNANVGEDDTVYHLGDFGFQKPRDLIDILWKLNGTIKLVPGNHDSNSFLNKVYEMPAVAVEVIDRYVELNHNGRKFVLCHYPIESWNNMSHGSIHLHGHSHGNSRAVPGRYDVGVDNMATKYAPVSIETVLSWYASEERVSRPDRRGGME